MKTVKLKQIIEQAISSEIRKAIIMENTEEVYMIKDKEGKPIEMCDTQEEAEEKLEVYNQEGKEFIIEKGKKPSFDELDEMSDELDETLTGNQEKIDMNHNGKIDADDFKKLRSGESEGDVNEGDMEVDPTYTHFAVNKETGKIFNGWEFEKGMDRAEVADWCKIDLKDDDYNPKDFKILTAAALKRNDIDPFDSDNWKTNDDYDLYMNNLHNDEEQSNEGSECMECDSEMKENKLKDFFSKKPNKNKGKVLLPKGDKNLEMKVFNDDEDMSSKKECSECGTMLNEEGVCSECNSNMYESENKTKNTIRLTEKELVKMIKNIAEAAIPGMVSYQAAHKGSGEENKKALADTEKKIKDSLSFDGNDNPEFPKQIGKGEKVARQNTEEQDEEVADNRGGGMEDLDYDYDPSDSFKERLKMSLIGDTKMGNSHDAANVIPSKLGEKMIKKVERRKKAIESAPMYNKDVQPSKEVNESDNAKQTILNEEMVRMKEMLSYNKKTQ